jgi:predicted RNA-binding Zn-ribbon protein involved in translation (DUF1610 family)
MDLLSQFLESTPATLSIKGKIKAGYYVVSALCPSCNKNITAVKPYEEFICQDCGSVTVVGNGKEPRAVSIDYFIVPEDIKQFVGDKPNVLRVIPAYREIHRTCRIMYAKKGKGGRILCESRDGKTAEKLVKDNSGNIVKVRQTCSKDDCIDRKNKYCKTNAVFYFILPDADVFGAYAFYTASELSIKNMLGTIKVLADSNGNIRRDPQNPLLLSILRLKRTSDNIYYNVYQLSLPRISIGELASSTQTQSDLKQIEHIGVLFD